MPHSGRAVEKSWAPCALSPELRQPCTEPVLLFRRSIASLPACTAFCCWVCSTVYATYATCYARYLLATLHICWLSARAMVMLTAASL